MDDEEYKITWFHMETTNKEDFKVPEYVCPKRYRPGLNCRNVITHERKSSKPAKKVDIVQPDVIQEYFIYEDLDLNSLQKNGKPFVSFTTDDVIPMDLFLKQKEEILAKRKRMIKKSKFYVRLSDMKETENYDQVINFAYKSNYNTNYKVKGFQFKQIIFTDDDYNRQKKLIPPPTEPKQMLHSYLVPVIETWKTIQSNNMAAAKDQACPQPGDLFPRKRDLLGCDILLDARRKGVLSHTYAWQPHHGGTKRRNPPFPTETKQIYRDYHVWHNPVDMSVIRSMQSQSRGK